MHYQTESNALSLSSTAVRRVVWIGALLGLAAAILCQLSIPSAQAAVPFEQTGVFSGSASPLSHGEIFGEKEEVEGEVKVKIKPDEEIQLGGVGSLAVNRTGAGGVPEGTTYAVTSDISKEGHPRVAMFEPGSEGGLKFAEGWEVSSEGEYERCGPAGELPDGETSHPPCPIRPEGAEEAQVGLDVDQETGDVYIYAGFRSSVFNEETRQTAFIPGVQQIAVYSADGGEIVTRFGEEAPDSRFASQIPGAGTIAASPGKVHEADSTDPLAVDSATGDVYIYDQTTALERYHRLMVFAPKSPGDYAHYEFAGELLTGTKEEHAARAPAFDDAGHLYAAGIDEGGNRIEEYVTPPVPAPYPGPEATPTCSFTYAKGGMTAFAVDPATGESFFYSYKRESAAHWVRRLGPCEGGTFEVTQKMPLAPERGDFRGLVFDPEPRAEPLRGRGVLYGAAPGSTPESGEGEPGQTALGYIFGASVEEPHPPVIESESIGSASTVTALFRATVNPEGFPTRYAFQYETGVEYEANPPGERFQGAEEVPLGGAVAGEGTAGISVASQVTGLSPGTEYRFRAVATNHSCLTEPEELCETPGEAVSFRTFPTQVPGLPDDRAWELVSPAEKNGGQVLPAAPAIGTCAHEGACKPGSTYSRFPGQSAPDGGAVAYEGLPFSGNAGTAVENEYVSRRGADGWQTVDLNPLAMERGASGFRSFAADLSRAVLLQSGPALSPAAPAGFPDLYTQRTDGTQELTPLLTAPPPHRTEGNDGSGDQLSIVYAGASADGSRVFFEANDALTEATADAPAAPEVPANEFNLYEWHEGALSLVNVAPGNAAAVSGSSFATTGENMISADGTRVFFSDSSGQVYMREDGQFTREIETEGVPDPGAFRGASTNGARVLLANGHLHGLGDEEPTIDLTEGKGGFEGVVGRSDDLAHVYFVDSEVLDETPNGAGEEAQAGSHNLYSWEEGGPLHFVAKLLTADNEGTQSNNGLADWSGAERTALASPNGRYLAFMSKGRLTNYDNIGPCFYHEHVLTTMPCSEVYLYDSGTGALRCASCDPTGAAPLGHSAVRTNGTQYITDAGRLYFDTQDSLSPFDTNGRYEDVYQYEPQGAGTCALTEGCLDLISSGREAVDSNLLAVDATGANVFFTTRDRLVPRDTDEQIDLYDARENGGFPSESETGASECQGEACQPPPSVPAFPSLGSTTFSGPGNVEEPTSRACPKGKVKKHGKCVKRKHRHHNRRAHR